MQAQAIAWQINTSMCAPKKPVEPAQFMPSEWRKRQGQQEEEQETSASLAAKVRMFLTRMRGG